MSLSEHNLLDITIELRENDIIMIIVTDTYTASRHTVMAITMPQPPSGSGTDVAVLLVVRVVVE